MLPLNEDDINLKMKYLSKTWQVLFKCSWIEKLMLMNILNEDEIKTEIDYIYYQIWSLGEENKQKIKKRTSSGLYRYRKVWKDLNLQT